MYRAAERSWPRQLAGRRTVTARRDPVNRTRPVTGPVLYTDSRTSPRQNQPEIVGGVLLGRKNLASVASVHGLKNKVTFKMILRVKVSHLLGLTAQVEIGHVTVKYPAAHGLKNKAMLAIGSPRSTSSVTSLRRQSFHAVPPSPLTRTLPVSTAAACPAAISTSPTVARSLSPLVGGHCLQAAGISNLSQSYSPACPAALFRNSLGAVEASLYASRRRSASPESIKLDQGRAT